MLKNITLGQYFPGNSLVHRLDPRTKILGVILLIACLFVADGFIGLAFVALATFAIACATGISLRFLVKGVKPIVMIVLLTFFINLFFSSTGNVIFQLWIIRITDAGLRNACFMGARLLLLVMTSQLLTLTTSPISLTDGIESLLNPLKKLHFPAHELAMMMSIALRFIPTLMEETDKIMKAQSARGADFDTGNLKDKARAMVPLLVPLFVSAFRRADELAQAMEARCYRGGEGRTRMKALRFAPRDGVAALCLSACLAAVILINRFLPW